MKPVTFDQQFFTANRKRMRELVKDADFIVLTANGVMQRNGDVTFAFRQDSGFWYLTGIEKPDIILVMDKTQEYLIMPARDAVIQKFDGLDDRDALTRVSGIAEVYDEKKGWQQLRRQLQTADHVATFLSAPPFIERHGFYSNPARARLLERIRGTKADVSTVDIRQTVTQMRVIKQPQELNAIQQAIDLTSDSMQKVVKNLRTYRHEYEIEAELTAAFKRAGHNHAFSPIVASGQNACTIHHVGNDGALDHLGLLILDIGAEVQHYAADLSRTYAVTTPSKRQKQIFDAVHDVQQYALSLLKPGVMIKEYEQQVERYMGGQLRSLGLISSKDKTSIRSYYPHATSHFLGLDTHDVGEYDQPLAANMVLTVEPGIYVPEEGIGVRIEDDVLITETGVKNLSEKLPVEL